MTPAPRSLATTAATIGFLRSVLHLPVLLRLLNVIDQPFKAGRERTDDDVSLFLLTEFVVHAQSEGTEALPPEDLAAKVDQLEEQLAEVEEAHAEGKVDDAASALEAVALPVGGEGTTGDALGRRPREG